MSTESQSLFLREAKRIIPNGLTRDGPSNIPQSLPLVSKPISNHHKMDIVTKTDVKINWMLWVVSQICLIEGHLLMNVNMSWMLIGSISKRQFFKAPKTNVRKDGFENFLNIVGLV